MAIVVNHIDLSFDLDGFLDMNLLSHQISSPPDTTLEVPNTPKDSEWRIIASKSSLPTVSTDGVCSVCLEDFDQREIFPAAAAGKQVPCGHVFHAACISTWLSICDSCPLCRSRCVISAED
ncbi:hypothetical protein LWI28_000221 [Acer negundo]|uniref:RING-type domain-containing protein n=1 Tax=Acer negundo TaxID=4023 RepID=A0AAD5J892_ACENE|nr:hypothetical protein LWI28_000221 [Acer negundo]KAK4838694.1 hypothetical protein QYF36_015702 [Acer negundo]